MRRWLRLAAAMALCLLLAGCWNYRELESFATVTCVAIDLSPEGDWQVTAELVDYSVGNDSSSGKSNLVSARGRTIFDAIRSMISQSGGKLYFGDAKALIISQDVARRGLANVMDFVVRDHEARISMILVVSAETTAQEILKLKSPNNGFTGYALESSLLAMSNSSKTPMVNIADIVEQLRTYGQAQALPVVSGAEVAGHKILSVSGAAYFSDGKLLGFLSPADTMSMLIVNNRLESGVFNIVTENESPAVKPFGRVGLEIKKLETKVRPQFEDDRLTFDIAIDTQVSVIDVETEASVIEDKSLASFKALAAKQVQDRVLSFVQNVQQTGMPDFLGLGVSVKRSLPQVWKHIEKDWPAYFASAGVNVSVKLDITTLSEVRKQNQVGD